jgi:hypothetical protein
MAFSRTRKPAVELLENRECPSNLAFSTYLGGSGNDGLGGTALAVDASGNTYVAGHTNSTNFPATAGSFQPSYNGGGNVGLALNGFVAKFNASGGLQWATYLGGSGGATDITALAIDASGNVFVTGDTTSAAFPTTPGTLEPTYPAGPVAAFLTELNASGSALVYSTFVGGGGISVGRALAVDSAGNAYVAIETTAGGNATTPGAFQPTYPGGSEETYIAKLNPGGTALVYATYLGGSTFDVPRGIALDASGNVYVDGSSRSTNFPTTPGAFQTTNKSATHFNGFVTKLNATGTALVYSTYLGGSGGDGCQGIAVDSAGNAYVTGVITSTDFPTVNPLQASSAGGQHAFVTKFNPTGTALVNSTYLGGSGSDDGNAIAVDSAGEAYVTGNTSSIDFPSANPVQANNGGGGGDAFVTKLNAAGATLLFSSYLGGSSLDFGQAIAIDPSGNIYVAGQTSSTDFPTTPGALQGSYGGGGSDAFVAKIAFLTATGTSVSATAGAPFNGTVASFSDTDHDPASNYTATIAWGDGNTSTGAIQANGSGGFNVSGTNTYAAAGTYTLTVTITDSDGSKATATSKANVTNLGSGVQNGQAAGIGFWRNKNGQALINSFNGGAGSTALANWLATTFPNLYGAGAGANNLTGKTNAQVATFYVSLFNLQGPKLDAEVLATALNVYATTSSLGGSATTAYGFTVTAAGLGADSYNVGANGDAFGVPNNTTLNVFQILKAADSKAKNGVLYNGDKTLRDEALAVFDGINQAGGI